MRHFNPISREAYHICDQCGSHDIYHRIVSRYGVVEVCELDFKVYVGELADFEHMKPAAEADHIDEKKKAQLRRDGLIE